MKRSFYKESGSVYLRGSSFVKMRAVNMPIIGANWNLTNQKQQNYLNGYINSYVGLPPWACTRFCVNAFSLKWPSMRSPNSIIKRLIAYASPTAASSISVTPPGLPATPPTPYAFWWHAGSRCSATRWHSLCRSPCGHLSDRRRTWPCWPSLPASSGLSADNVRDEVAIWNKGGSTPVTAPARFPPASHVSHWLMPYREK